MLDPRGMIRELRAELKEWIREYLSTFVKLLPYTNSTASGEHEKVQGYPTEGADEKPYDYEARRVWPFGIRSRPPAGVLAVWIGNRGRSGNGVCVGAESSRFGPSDLADGEVAIYCKIDGALLKLDLHGAVALNAAGGQLVNIQGGTNGAARIGDDLSASAALKTWAAAIESGITGLGGVAPVTSFATGAGVAGALGTIHSGSSKTKIG